MRDFLEDVHEHMQDGVGRAQAAAKPQLPKRFYKNAEVVETESGFGIALDGKLIKTPAKKLVELPKRELADCVCLEWAAQAEKIDASSMPHTRLLNSAVEGGPDAVEPLRKEVVNYVGNDMMLFRADSPQELVAEQERVWDPILSKIASSHSVTFTPIIGIIHQDQPATTLAKMDELLDGLDCVALTALMSVTNLTGSGLLAISLWLGFIDADDAWIAAHVDEDHNIRLWGEDYEAKARRDKRRVEFDAAVTVIKAYRA